KAKKETDDLGKSFKTLGQIMDEQKVSAQTQISRLDTLVKASQNVKIAMTDRIAAVKELQSKYPSYFGNLSQEDILAGKVSGAYQRLSASILAAAEARAYEKAIEEEANKRLETRRELIQNLIQQAETRREIAQLSVSGGTLLAAGSAQQRAGELAVAEARLRDLQKAQENLSTQLRNSYGTAAKYAREIQKTFEGTEGSLKELIGDGAGKAAEAVKRTMTEVKTDLSTIGSPIADGLLKAVKKFDKACADSIARAARQLSGDDFVDVVNKAQQGLVPKREVQPILTPKDTPTEPGTEESKEAEEWSRGMRRATDRFSRDFYRALEDIAAQGKLTFGGVFSGIVQSFTSSFQNIFVQHFSEKLKASFSDLSSSFSTKMQGAISAIGIAGGLLQSTGTAAGQIAGGALSGVASGALVGASIGAVGGPLGAVVGGVVGLIGGIFRSNKRREEIQKQQLEQLKKAVAYTSQV